MVLIEVVGDDDALITVFNVCNNDDEWMINDGKY